MSHPGSTPRRSQDGVSGAPAAADATARTVIAVAAAALLINGLLSMRNLWPTPLVVPDARLAPEAVLAWCVLLIAVRAGRAGPRVCAVLAAATLALVVGRYADVTVPALFGRSLNLYWDGRQIPRFVSVIAQHGSVPVAVATVLGTLGALSLAGVLLYRALRWSWRVLERHAAPRALRSRSAMLATGVALALVVANYAGVRATWPVVSKPVLPTWIRQADLLITAFSPSRLAAALPASPAFDAGLSALRGADVSLVFLESYGAVVYDDAELHRRLAPGRARVMAAVAGSGRGVVSAFVTSPTFAGASELAHLGLLSGLDLSDPLRHDLLLTTERPSLVSHFRRHGWRTYGLYPALSWDWPERSHYGFDVFLDGRDLGWTGPKLGPWWIPDQYTIARFEQRFPASGDAPPRFLFFPTITSHAPFAPVPPYQPDWARMLSDAPYDAAEAARALAQRVDWLDMRPGYAGMIAYTYDWVAGWLAQPRARRELVLMLGDHQPTSGVTGPGARWDVPVHVFSDDPELLERFVAAGFVPGMEPAPAAIGAMHELTALLLSVLDGRPAPSSKRSAGPPG